MALFSSKFRITFGLVLLVVAVFAVGWVLGSRGVIAGPQFEFGRDEPRDQPLAAAAAEPEEPKSAAADRKSDADRKKNNEPTESSADSRRDSSSADDRAPEKLLVAGASAEEEGSDKKEKAADESEKAEGDQWAGDAKQAQQDEAKKTERDTDAKRAVKAEEAEKTEATEQAAAAKPAAKSDDDGDQTGDSQADEPLTADADAKPSRSSDDDAKSADSRRAADDSDRATDEKAGPPAGDRRRAGSSAKDSLLVGPPADDAKDAEGSRRADSRQASRKATQGKDSQTKDSDTKEPTSAEGRKPAESRDRDVKQAAAQAKNEKAKDQEKEETKQAETTAENREPASAKKKKQVKRASEPMVTVEREARDRNPPSELPGGLEVAETTRRFGDEIELITRIPARAIGNQPIAVEATVRNVSGEAIPNVALVRYVSDSLTNVRATLDSRAIRARSAPGELTYYDIGVLESDATRTLELTGNPTSDASEVEVQFGVEYPRVVKRRIPVKRLNLAVDLSAVTDKERSGLFYPCDPVRLRYEVRNEGDVDVGRFVIRQDLPVGVRSKKNRNQTIAIAAQDLTAGSMFDHELEIEVAEALSFQPTATIESEFGRIEAAGDRIRFDRPRLQIAIEGPSKRTIGDPVEYTITVRNRGNAPSLDTALELTPTDNTKIVKGGGNGVKRDGNTFRMGRLERNAQKVVRVSLEADEPRTMALKAEANGYCAPSPVSAQIETRLDGIPAVEIELVDEKDPVRVGDRTKYRSTVRNEGSQELDDMKLRVKLPSLLKLVGSDGPTKSEAKRGELDLGTLPTLATGKEFVWNLEVEALRTGQAYLETELQSPVFGRAIIEQEPTTIY